MIGVEWAPIAGALVGAVVGLTGVGGGALMAPILLFGFGVALPTVIATDLLFATITKLASSAIHTRNNFVDWQITKRMWLGSIPATIVVLWLVYSGFVLENSEWIVRILGVLILLSALSLLFGNKLQTLQRHNRIDAPEAFKKIQLPATTLSGLILGALVSLTSVGAGALGAVILRSLYPLRMVPRKLVATDTIHAIPLSLIAGAGYLLLGHADLKLLALLLLGSVPAALIASQSLKYMNVDLVKAILAAALIVAGTKLLLG